MNQAFDHLFDPNLLSLSNLQYFKEIFLLQLRNAQEHIMELETEKDHLQKRVEKYKQRRKEEF